MIVTKANLELVEKSPLNLKSQFDSPHQIVQLKVHDSNDFVCVCVCVCVCVWRNSFHRGDYEHIAHSNAVGFSVQAGLSAISRVSSQRVERQHEFHHQQRQ